jgi:hypothetical protein
LGGGIVGRLLNENEKRSALRLEPCAAAFARPIAGGLPRGAIVEAVEMAASIVARVGDKVVRVDEALKANKAKQVRHRRRVRYHN